MDTNREPNSQENIIKTYDYNGITVDLIEWSDTIWCGKVGYADNNTDEPNVEKLWKSLCLFPPYQTAVKIIGIFA